MSQKEAGGVDSGFLFFFFFPPFDMINNYLNISISGAYN